ncbi:MAG: SBBP repeat-containing protein [Verrucomicrobia bacterium]|nr:SBBP repeat-containing protein [Verrucomicrobiota bacterium]
MKRFIWRSGRRFSLAARALAALALLVATPLWATPRPTLDWSTYLGGNTDEYAHDMAVDGSGNVIVVGNTFSGGWASGGYDTRYGTSRDGFVAKFNSAGTLLWSTYLGGNSDDQANGVTVDAAGNIFVVGNTRSRQWVSGAPGTNFFGTNYNDVGLQDAFAAKLGPDGSHVWSTFLGGADWEDGNGIALDGAGNVLVTGYTRSQRWLRGGSVTNSLGGGDAFVAKLSPSGAHLWSTALGKGGYDAGVSLVADGANNIFVAGDTRSGGWGRGVPADKNFGTNYNGSQDGFVAKLNPAGSNVWTAYLGGRYDEHANNITLDALDNILVAGWTTSSNWVSGGFKTNFSGVADTFVVKLTAAGAHVWSTYVGGVNSDSPGGLDVDGAGSVFVAGTTYSAGWVRDGFDTTLNLVSEVFSNSWSIGGFDVTSNAMSDAFVAKLSSTGAQLWSTYLGATNQDGGNGVGVDGAGNVFTCGFTVSTNWVSGGFDTTPNGYADVFVAKIRDLDPACAGTVLATPTLMSPLNNSSNGAWSPTLTWSPVGGESGFVVQLFEGRACAPWPAYISPLLPPGTTNFTVPSTAGLGDRRYYSWTVQAKGDGTTFCDSAWSGCWSFTNWIADRSWPSINFTDVKADSSNAVLTVKGRANDNGRVAQVFYQFTNTQWQLANGTTNWEVALPLQPGTNWIRLFSVDAAGNRSGIIHQFIFFHVPSTLTLVTNGQGRIDKLTFSGDQLEVGRGYTLRATPLNNRWLFSNWSGTISATNNPLVFIMQTNLVLQANFVTNPFIALRGSYAGLFFATNDAQSVSNCGYFSLDLADQGTYSGRLLLGGMAAGFSGRFNVSNHSRVTVLMPVRLAEPVEVVMTLNSTDKTLNGSVSNSVWSAELRSDLQAKTNQYAGAYTLVVVGSGDSTNGPGGYGAGAITVSAGGGVSVTGTAGDGQTFSQQTAHAADGMWPMFLSLHGGRAMLMGWMSFNANAPALWNKQPLPGSRYYTNGFTQNRSALAAKYTAPTGGQSAMNWVNGLVTIGGGNLPALLTSQVVLTNNQFRVIGGSISNLSLTLSAANGQFNGSFRHPATRASTPVRGALVQDPLSVYPFGSAGWFLGTNQSGFLLLTPQP